jgi:hypothetical protein
MNLPPFPGFAIPVPGTPEAPGAGATRPEGAPGECLHRLRQGTGGGRAHDQHCHAAQGTATQARA